jgi:predicted GNAT family acetyltransferase
MTSIEVRDNPANSRFEAIVAGEVAGFAEYERAPGTVTFSHTVVDPAFGGQGIGGELAKAVLDAAVRDSLAVIPQCEFIAGYIEKHPEYLVHVEESARNLVQ